MAEWFTVVVAVVEGVGKGAVGGDKGKGLTPPVPWYKDVWDSWIIPKHCVIGWLIQRKALNTRVKLFQHGISGSNCCVFCELAPETHDHLFSVCIYNKQVISLIEHWMNLRFQTPPGHCPTVRRKVWRVIKLSCWYVLWLERNTCRLDLKLRRPELLVSEIQKTVQLRVQQKMSSISKQMDVVWLNSLGINS
ncbi:uncharacterized protein LOC141620323 [Silene latifolia]|uniref:uncharacterized protein LOC141620323 n=1 Tax=Silene latifolia TaxID=37657 RepID=UPI003D789FD8